MKAEMEVVLTLVAHVIWSGVGIASLSAAGARGDTGFGPVVWMTLAQLVGVVLANPPEERSLRARIAGWVLVATGTAIGIRYLAIGQ